MKTLLLISMFLILPASAMAQRVVEPTKLVLATAAEDADEPDEVVEAFHNLLRRELNKRRDVVVCGRCNGLNVYATAQAITKEGRLVGYTAAVIVVSDSKPRERYWLTLKTGPTLEGLARGVAQAMNIEVFKREK